MRICCNVTAPRTGALYEVLVRLTRRAACQMGSALNFRGQDVPEQRLAGNLNGSDLDPRTAGARAAERPASRFYLSGGTPGQRDAAAGPPLIQGRIAGICRVAGTRDGFARCAGTTPSSLDINASGMPIIVLVALGVPLQEKLESTNTRGSNQ